MAGPRSAHRRRQAILGALLGCAHAALAGGPLPFEAIKECRWDGPTLLVDVPCALRLARQNSFEILDQETFLKGSERREKLAERDFAVLVTPSLSAVTTGSSAQGSGASTGTATATPSTDLYRAGLGLSKLFSIGTNVSVQPFYEFGGGNRATGLSAGISQPFLRGVAPVYVRNTLDAAKSQERVAGWSQVQSCLGTLVGVVDQLSTLGEIQERHRLFPNLSFRWKRS